MAQMAEKRETILVVDDTLSILTIVTGMLRHASFPVLHATSGDAALIVAAVHVGNIDLLLSDIQMRTMSGPELGIKLKVLRPEMHVMLMSGMANGNLLVLNYGWAFIEKPFLADKLLTMIDAVLHSPDRSQGPD